MGLNTKRQAFCQEYLRDSDATKAAIRAGYARKSASSIGSDLLKDPEVMIYLEVLRKEVAEAAKVESTRVLEELAKVGFSKITSVVSWDADGNLELVGSADLKEAELASIASIKRTKEGVIEVKMHPKVEALDKLARALGMYNDSINLNSGGKPLAFPPVIMLQGVNVEQAVNLEQS